MNEQCKRGPLCEEQNPATIEDPDVIITRSVGGERPKPRLRRSTRNARHLGKLDSVMFETHRENIWRKLSLESYDAFFCLDALWFYSYHYDSRGPKILTWIKALQIFSKKYVFVPIVMWNHWSLLVLCHIGDSSGARSGRRCMLLLDSLKVANSSHMKEKIKSFVRDLFKLEERRETAATIENIPLLSASGYYFKVPQQSGNDECGYYVLFFMHRFVQTVPDDFRYTNGKLQFMENEWFSPEAFRLFVKTLSGTTDRIK